MKDIELLEKQLLSMIIIITMQMIMRKSPTL